MTPIRCKPEVRLVGLSHAMVAILAGLREAVDASPHLVPDEVVITSINDGTHMRNSRHYRDEAIDVRSKSFLPHAKRPFMAALGARLGPQFTVLLEREGTEHEHYHVQVRKGWRFP